MFFKPYLDKVITYALTPARWVYGAGVWFHNKLYDDNIKKQKSFKIPVISVGNLTVGGTGKTPHVEYLIDQLEDNYNIAVLSRGYKRKTKGFVLASSVSTPEQIGDEPYQIYRKYKGRVKVAVAANRKKAIEKMLKLFPEINMVILDDAYQYRDVKPMVSILLLDYSRPIDNDALLPLGRLREPQHATERADIIIFTKCNKRLTPFDFRALTKSVNPLSFQKTFFSSIEFQDLRPVFPENSPYSGNLENLTENDAVLLVTGIAHPRSFVKFFKGYPFKVRVMRFPDHHDFSKRDIQQIIRYFSKMPGKRKIIVTTEKDSVRMLHNPYFPYKLKPYTFYLPIRIRVHPGLNGESFEEELEKKIKFSHLDQ